MVDTLDFLFASYITELKLKNPAARKLLIGTNNKSFRKKLLSLGKTGRKGKPGKLKTYENDCSTPAKYLRKKLRATQEAKAEWRA